MTYSGPWRVVNSLTTLRLQLDAAFPERSHASDGTIADDAHSTSSDHYPKVYPALGSVPVVTAFDGTQDPAHGCDNAVITEAIRVSRDARVKYVIWDHRMYSSYATSSYPAWAWRPYTGSDDPHTNHFHISVQPTALADSTAPWAIGVDMGLTPTEFAEIVQGALDKDNVLHWRLRGIQDSEDPAIVNGPFGKPPTPGLKQLADGMAKLADGLATLTAKVDAIEEGGGGLSDEDRAALEENTAAVKALNSRLATP